MTRLRRVPLVAMNDDDPPTWQVEFGNVGQTVEGRPIDVSFDRDDFGVGGGEFLKHLRRPYVPRVDNVGGQFRPIENPRVDEPVSIGNENNQNEISSMVFVKPSDAK